MKRLVIETPRQSQRVLEGLYRDMERRIASSPLGLCPVDMALNFLRLCHAQTCGKCVPCRVGLGQLTMMLEDVLDGEGGLDLIDRIESTAQVISDTADCAIGYEAARMVLQGVRGFRDDYEEHLLRGRCICGLQHSIPCTVVCPAHVDVPGYIALVKAGRCEDAVRLIRKDNPFPAVCGYVCEHPCEARCRRHMVDDAVNICGIKRYAVDHAGPIEPPPCAEPTGKKVAIVGGGPGGLTAAYFLTLMGHRAVVYEQRHKLGGMLRYGIPDYRLPPDVLDKDIQYILDTGVETVMDTEVGGPGLSLDQLKAQYDAVYISIGAHDDKKLRIPGEDSQGVVSAVRMLRDIGEGRVPDLAGKRVVVIGGGNVAIDVARSCLRCGADAVAMYCLEQENQMPASPEEIAEARQEGAVIHCGWGPSRILQENGKVTGVEFKRCVSVTDANGRFAPVYDENDTMTVPCDQVFMSIGQSIQWGGLLTGSTVQLGGGRRAQADPLTYQTAQPDVFVGGDVYTGPSFAIDAIAAGKQGAVSIHRFVQPNTSMTIGRDRRQFIELDKDNAVLTGYDTAARQYPAMDGRIDHTRSFRDAHGTFTEEQVKTETARCLGCGASVVDPNKCIGCGLCTTKCEFDAIHLSRELPDCSNMVRSEDKFKAILPYMLKREMKIRFGKKEK